MAVHINWSIFKLYSNFYKSSSCTNCKAVSILFQTELELEFKLTKNEVCFQGSLFFQGENIHNEQKIMACVFRGRKF